MKDVLLSPSPDRLHHRFTPEEIALRKDELHSWSGNHVGLTIEAHEGTVWVTQADDRGIDVILCRGESFRIDRPGRVVAQGLTPKTRLILRSNQGSFS